MICSRTTMQTPRRWGLVLALVAAFCVIGCVPPDDELTEQPYSADDRSIPEGTAPQAFAALEEAATKASRMAFFEGYDPTILSMMLRDPEAAQQVAAEAQELTGEPNQASRFLRGSTLVRHEIMLDDDMQWREMGSLCLFSDNGVATAVRIISDELAWFVVVEGRRGDTGFWQISYPARQILSGARRDFPR